MYVVHTYANGLGVARPNSVFMYTSRLAGVLFATLCGMAVWLTDAPPFRGRARAAVEMRSRGLSGRECRG